MTTRARLLSAVTASGISAIAATGLLLGGAALPARADDVRTPLFIGAAGSGIGIIVAWYVGWTRLGDALSTRRGRLVVVRVSVRAVVTGAAIVAVVLGTLGATWPTDVTSMTLDRVGPAVLYPLAGAAFVSGIAFAWGLAMFGIPALALTMPIVALWRVIVRRVLGTAR